VTSEETARFTAAKERIIGKNRERNGIGTLSEKTVHAVLKNYYAPDETQHEIPVEGCVADIFNGKEIIEIQTRSFDRMRPKLERFLPLYPVTIVYPIPYCKHVFWIDEETGEISGGRKSPLKGSPYLAFKELYRIKAYLQDPNLTIRLTFLNMEEYSGFEELMGKGFAHNLSDLLYYVRQDNQNLLYKMNSMIQTINNLDYVPPVQMPADIRTTAWQDWERLFQMLILDSSYEVIVLDIGCGIDENFQLLDMCKKIYMPVLSDAVSQCKIAQFENLVRIWDYPQILEKTEKINPPFHMATCLSPAYVEQLMWSELGDYVRNLLRKESQKKEN